MKSIHHTFILFFLTSLFLSACSDDLTGSNQSGELEGISSTGSSERMADLSLRLEVGPSTLSPIDSVFNAVTVYVHNDGPSDASGIQVAFTSDASCQFAVVYDNEGNLIRAVTSHSEGNTGDDDEPGGGDIILVDIIGPTIKSTSTSIELMCLRDVHEYTRISAEIVQSDLPDPDSTPGNGDASEDDQVEVLTEPEVPPCPDCPN